MFCAALRSGSRNPWRCAAHRMQLTQAGAFSPLQLAPKASVFQETTVIVIIAVCILNQGVVSVGTYPTRNFSFCC